MERVELWVGHRFPRLGRVGFLVAIVAIAAIVGCTDQGQPAQSEAKTRTPIKHLVVVFGENISFDHYFATYPNAKNRIDEPPFSAEPATPTPNNLLRPLDPTNGFMPVDAVDLLRNNPNFTAIENGADAANPVRLGPSEAVTVDMGHDYTPEQRAAHAGAMDLFPMYVGNAGPPPDLDSVATLGKGLVMAYYDGNTVSAIWDYAQNFALNDNSWSTTFGPSTPGAINLISGQTNGVDATNTSAAYLTPDGNGGYTLLGDPDPVGDVCSGSQQASLRGRNIGDLLNAKGIRWGWFQGGFDLGITNEDGSTGCQRQSAPTAPHASTISADYVAHHAPFQYYAATANPTHSRPSSVSAIGSTFADDRTSLDPANHQYDSHDFFDALNAGNFPAVSFLKAPAFQDGHAGNSNPLDEQDFIVQVVSAVQASKDWASTAIVLAYDDSDGWYDHQAPPIVNLSNGAADALNGDRLCNHAAEQGEPAPSSPLLGQDGKPALGRCGYGTRLPLLVISPFARRNYVDHTLTDQTSITRFIEDNWLGGERIQPGGSFDTIAGSIENMFECPDGLGEFPHCADAR